jgi:CheY-like chemotaxis protein
MAVLVVDDDDATAEALCELLEADGFSAVCVPDGQQALDHMRGGDPVCLVLLDLMMPVMNGFEFRDEQLRDASLSGVPVVIVTADLKPAEKARQLRADGYLSKPISPEALLEITNRFCRSGANAPTPTR